MPLGLDPRQTKMAQARSILEALGFDAQRINDRSALTLLALVNVQPATPWANASSPMIGVTPIMEWVLTQYERSYAPNSRETFRRFTLHQFVEHGLVLYNPDHPARATK